MVEQTIICPFCKKEIPLTQAITQRIPGTHYIIL